MGDNNDAASKKHAKTSEEIAIREAIEVRDKAIREAKEAERRAIQRVIDAAEKAIFEAKDAMEKAIIEAKAIEKSTINNILEAKNKARAEVKREAIEVKERDKREAEEAKKAREAEEKARREAERLVKERDKREAIKVKERAKREAEEARKARIEAGQIAREKAEKEAIEARAVPYEGMVKLVIMPPVDFDHIKELGEDLHQFENLRLVLIGGSIREGAHIIVSTDKPTALIDILNQIPRVKKATSRGNEIQITLK